MTSRDVKHSYFSYVSEDDGWTTSSKKTQRREDTLVKKRLEYSIENSYFRMIINKVTSGLEVGRGESTSVSQSDRSSNSEPMRRRIERSRPKREALTLVHNNPCATQRDLTCDSHMYRLSVHNNILGIDPQTQTVCSWERKTHTHCAPNTTKQNSLYLWPWLRRKRERSRFAREESDTDFYQSVERRATGLT